MKITEFDGRSVFAIEGFLTGDECTDLIRRSESYQFETGTVGTVVADGFRNNDRVLFDSPELAAEMFERVRIFLPGDLDGWTPIGFNERWRYYRYGPKQYFKPHRDGTYHRFREGEESKLTFMIYLNDAATGGETRFFRSIEDAFQYKKPYLTVTPKCGMALLFLHEIWHEGAEVLSGTKYVLRTDVMYRRP